MTSQEKAFLKQMDLIVKLQSDLLELVERSKKYLSEMISWSDKMKELYPRNIEVQETIDKETFKIHRTQLERAGLEAINQSRRTLWEAGNILGFNTSPHVVGTGFYVTVEGEDRLRFYPETESAKRMMDRYESLLLERELSRD